MNNNQKAELLSALKSAGVLMPTDIIDDSKVALPTVIDVIIDAHKIMTTKAVARRVLDVVAEHKELLGPLIVRLEGMIRESDRGSYVVRLALYPQRNS